jgi:hypothetical protein
MAIDTTAGVLSRVTARRLFAVPGALPDWGITPDGRRFLFAVPISDPQAYQIVRDWQAAIPKLRP